VDQITVTGDGASHLAVEVSIAVEGLLDGLHREVGVTAINARIGVLSRCRHNPLAFTKGRAIS
jgi:hypothetical protein